MITIRVGADWNSGRPGGGKWMHELLKYGDLALSSTLHRPAKDGSDGGGGILTASWSMTTPAGVSLPPQLEKHALVEFKVGRFCIGMGYIAEPGADEVTIDGLFRLGEEFQAVDASGLPTTDISVAVAQAIASGLRWRNPGTLPTGSVAALSEEQVNYNTLSSLLNKYCFLNGKLWWIDRRGYLRIGDYPTTPQLLLSPDLPSPESDDEDFASTVFVRRVDGVDGDGQPNAWDGASATDTTAPYVKQTSFDLEQLGYISDLAAAGYAQAILDSDAYRTGFTSNVEVVRGQVTTFGGVPPEVWQIIGADPQMVRSPNYVSAASQVKLGRRRDWLLGGAQWADGSPLTLVPFGLAPRSVAAIEQDSNNDPKLVFS